MPRVFGYARASTTEQKDSMDIQAEAIKSLYDFKFAQQKDMVYAGLYGDPGISGSTPLACRPAGLRLINELQSGDVVIVAKLDRAWRSARDCLETLERWRKQGVRLILRDFDDLDTGTPIGEFFLTMLAAFAQFERARIRERVKDANAFRRRAKRPTNGNPPYGYKIVGPKGKRKLKMDWRARHEAQKIVEWVDSGWSFDRVYFHLIEHRVKRRSGPKKGQNWSRAGIVRVYKGEKKLQAREAEKAARAAQEAQAAPAEQEENLGAGEIQEAAIAPTGLG